MTRPGSDPFQANLHARDTYSRLQTIEAHQIGLGIASIGPVRFGTGPCCRKHIREPRSCRL